MSSTSCRKVSSSRVRSPTARDFGRIYCQLTKAMEANPEATVVRLAESPSDIVRGIVTGAVSSLIVDDAFLLVYASGNPWYSNEVVLEELMVLRIGKGSSFASVCDLLDDLAEDVHASVIVVGGALARKPRALTRMYQSRGYVSSDVPSLIKRR